MPSPSDSPAAVPSDTGAASAKPKAFASHGDLQDKRVSFTQLSANAWAYTAEGDPNTGVFIGDEAAMVVDTQATPAMAQDLIRRIRQVTDVPIKKEKMLRGQLG